MYMPMSRMEYKKSSKRKKKVAVQQNVVVLGHLV